MAGRAFRAGEPTVAASQRFDLSVTPQWKVSVGNNRISMVVANAPGLNMCGLGDFSRYQQLFKRLGYAVIHGERQQQKTGVELAIEHGFAPKRKGDIVGAVSIPLFMAKQKNGLSAAYVRRRAHTAVTHPEWEKKRSDWDARRYITKIALRKLWKAWHHTEAATLREAA